MSKTTVAPNPTDTKRRAPRRTAWGFEPKSEPRHTPTGAVMQNTGETSLRMLENAIASFMAERFKITLSGIAWADAPQKYGPLGDELAEWIEWWVKARKRIERRLDSTAASNSGPGMRATRSASRRWSRDSPASRAARA